MQGSAPPFFSGSFTEAASTDIWVDIQPVRHKKYYRRDGANELPLRLMDRIIKMTAEPGDTVFDPFGGAGTNCIAAELKGRKWMECETGPEDDIVNRFSEIDEEREYLKIIRKKLNSLFTKKIGKKRRERNLWTCESAGTPPASDYMQKDLFELTVSAEKITNT